MLKYPLAVCILAEAECKSIIFSEIKATLLRLEIASNIITAMRDAPVGDLGAGVLSLYHYMEASETTCLVEQVNRGTPPSDIL